MRRRILIILIIAIIIAVVAATTCGVVALDRRRHACKMSSDVPKIVWTFWFDHGDLNSAVPDMTPNRLASCVDA